MTEIINFHQHVSNGKLKTCNAEDEGRDCAKEKFIEFTNELSRRFLNDAWFNHKYFIEALPKEILDALKIRRFNINDALHDLNLISTVEIMLGVSPIIFGPGATNANADGWFAGFNLNGRTFSSPEIDSEILARAFNILLFLKMRNVLSAL